MGVVVVLLFCKEILVFHLTKFRNALVKWKFHWFEATEAHMCTYLDSSSCNHEEHAYRYTPNLAYYAKW